MIDREKVIKGLKCCCGTGMCFHGCPYHEASQNIWDCTSQLTLEALELLREQEPVKPKQRNPHLGAWWYECGNCDTAISPSDNYCRGCGRAIDWS